MIRHQAAARILIASLTTVLGLQHAAAQQHQDPDAYVRSLAKQGPFLANLGSIAQIQVPPGYLFVDKQNIRKFNDLYQNPTGTNEMGALLPADQSWFIIFVFEDVGYVKDDDKDELDADELLKSIQNATESGNAERQRRGWAPFHVVGWEQEPFYDPESNNLTWAIRGQSGGEDVVNYESRILGRRGVMSANLVIDPPSLQATLPTYKSLLRNYSYQPGQKYSEWRAGDKVAEYGLGGLVLGGAAVVAAKSGFLGKLLKPIIVGAIAIFGAIGAFFKRLFGNRE